jgi:Tfp pilus assembly protein PilO
MTRFFDVGASGGIMAITFWSRGQVQRFILICLSLLILVEMPIYFFFIRPEMEVDEKASARLTAIQQEIVLQERAVKMLVNFESRLKMSRRAFQDFSQKHLFPKNRVGSELLSDLEKISVEAGLLRNRVVYQFQGKPIFGLRRIDFSVPLEGSYGGIRRFLNILEGSPHFILIDSISLESDREGAGGGIRMDLNLSTFCADVP